MGDIPALMVIAGLTFAAGFGSGFALRAMISRRRRMESRRAAGLL